MVLPCHRGIFFGCCRFGVGGFNPRPAFPPGDTRPRGPPLPHGYPQTHAMWRRVARALDCGHFLPEEAPDAVVGALREFLAD